MFGNLVAACLSVLVSACLYAPPSDAMAGIERRAGSWAVFAPGITFDSAGTSLSKVAGLDSASIYLYREGVANPTQLALGGRWVDRVEASSTSNLIAADITGKGGNAVLVVDSTGHEFARFPHAWRSVWSPDGARLAIWYATEYSEEYPQPDSVGIWEVSGRHLRIAQVRPYGVGWLTNELVSLDYWRRIDALDLRTWSVRKTRFSGTSASPDTLFSISNRYESGVEAWDERSRAEMTERMQAILEGGDLRAYPEPFWVGGTAHLLCISACLYWDADRHERKRPYECNVYVVNPESGIVVAKIPGKGIGPTADRNGIVTLRDRTIRFEKLPTK